MKSTYTKTITLENDIDESRKAGEGHTASILPHSTQLRIGFWAEMRTNNQGFLTCVERNPGPISQWSLLHAITLTKQYIKSIEERQPGQYAIDYIIDALDESYASLCTDFKMPSASYMLFCSPLSVSGSVYKQQGFSLNETIASLMADYLNGEFTLDQMFLARDYFLSNTLRFHRMLFLLNDVSGAMFGFRPNNQGFLVGVETNPGPGFWSRIGMLLVNTNLGVAIDGYIWERLLVSIVILLFLILLSVVYPPVNFATIFVHSIMVQGAVWQLVFYASLAYYVGRNNQGYLVGVEENPGPFLEYIGPDNRIFRWFATMFLCLFSLEYYFGVFGFEEALFGSGLEKPCNQTHRANNQGFLVGIEPNPGPKTDLLISYLRNIEKEKTPPRKRGNGSGASPYVVRKQEKKKTLVKALRKASSTRHTSLLPESGVHLKHSLAKGSIGLSEDTKTFLTVIVDSFKNMIANFRPTVKVEIDWTSCIVTNLKNIFVWAKANLVWLFDFMKFVMNLIFSVLDKQWKAACEVLAEFICFSPESGLDLAVSSALYATTIGKHMKHGDIFGILKSLKAITKDSSSITTVRQAIWKLVSSLIVKVNAWFGTDFHVATGYDHIDSYWERFREVCRRLDSDDANRYEIAICMYALMGEVEDAYRICTDPDEKDQLRFLVAAMKPKNQDCEANINPNCGPRCEPLGVCIGGPTGTGKSTFTFPLLLALLAKVIRNHYPDRIDDFKRDHNGLIFYRHLINEFWDGYHRSHMAIVYDEFGQLRDAPGSPTTDAAEVLSLINTSAMHLHYSSIADKAKHYATPKVVWATTNREQFKFDAIISPEAVARRFKVSVIQVPKRKYCTNPDTPDLFSRRLDIEKVRADHPEVPDDPETWFVPEVLEWVKHDFNTGRPVTGAGARTFEFYEFVDYLYDMYTQSATKGQKILDFHAYIKNKFLIPESGDVNSAVPEDANSDGYHTPDEVGPSRTMKLFKQQDVELLPINHLIEMEECEPSYFVKHVRLIQDQLDDIRLRYPSPLQYFSPETMKVLKVCFASLSACFAITKLYRWFTKPVEESSLTSKKRPVRKREIETGVREGLNKFAPESGVSDVLTRLLLRNCYRVYVDGKFLGFATFIKGAVGLMPLHFLDISDENFRFDFVNYYGGQIAMSVFVEDMDYEMFSGAYSGIPGSNADMVIFRLGDPCRMHKDITSMMLSRSQFKKGDCYSSVLPVLRSASNDEKRENASVYILTPDVRITDSVSYGKNSYASSLLSYYADTAPADCGALLLTNDKRLGGPKILGFHTGGAAQSFFGYKTCCGVSFFRDDITMAYEDLMCEEESILSDEELDFNIDPEAGFLKLGSVVAPGQPSRSKIVPSPFHGELWDVTTAPARLAPFEKDGVKISPRDIAHEKYHTPNVCNDPHSVDHASVIVGDLILKKFATEPWKPRVFSYHEAVAGVDGVEFVDAVKRQTSAGYPHVLDKEKTKARWLGKDGKPDPTSQGYKELQSMVESVIDKARRGVRSTHFYMDCLKDERRPLDRVAAGKTRQFMACPVEYTIAVKMYFGDFARHVSANRIDNGVAIGCNPHLEWDKLYTHLHPREGYRHGAGDHESFDAKLKTKVMWCFLRIVEDFYGPTSTPEDRRVRAILFMDMLNSLHVTATGKVYEFFGKNPSGNPLTSVMNSVCNAMMIVAAWLYNGIPVQVIKEKFRWITGGDDHVTGFPTEYEDRAGSVALARALKFIFDSNYTDEKKGTELVPSKDMSEVTFYKRSFLRVGKKMCAPLELDVIKETLNWQKRTCTKEEFELRIDCALIELAQHGPRVFLDLSPKILTLSADHGFSLRHTSWKSAFEATSELTYTF